MDLAIWPRSTESEHLHRKNGHFYLILVIRRMKPLGSTWFFLKKNLPLDLFKKALILQIRYGGWQRLWTSSEKIGFFGIFPGFHSFSFWLRQALALLTDCGQTPYMQSKGAWKIYLDRVRWAQESSKRRQNHSEVSQDAFCAQKCRFWLCSTYWQIFLGFQYFLHFFRKGFKKASKTVIFTIFWVFRERFCVSGPDFF